MLSWKTLTAAAAGVLALGAVGAAAQDYPSRPVTFIVPFAPGGGADASQRVFNKYAEPIIGQALPITNRPGAAGTTGWAELVRAEPDGYTLGIVAPPLNVIPALTRPGDTGYTLDQFTNICIYAVVPDVIVVRRESQFETLQDLVDYARENPGQVAAANTGTLSADYMVLLMIQESAGIEMSQVPFNSGAYALQATLAGTTDAMIGSTLYAVAQADTMRTLAIASPERDPMIPDIPTFSELGYDVVSERYRVLAGPAGLPQEVVDYWADVCEQVTSNPDFVAEMETQGQPAAFLGPDEAAERIGNMAASMEAIIEKYNLVP